MIYNIGDVVIAKVVKTGNKFITTKTKDGFTFFIDKREISDFSKKNIYEMFSIGETINFIALKVTTENNQKIGYGSFKKNHPNELKENISTRLKETPNGFKNIYEHSQKMFNTEDK
ncbi:30S ribosomal protein S1 [Mycoplasmopsis canis UFG4]|uniref:30S ribosomal protein S1 n=1 Tax=Mycoplasmopsis canis UFG4 TaxID=1131455 RepID=I1A7D0_9BACT|nr:S1 RNA-binding domain protein [Mycoplasmopsis canis]AKF40881.1 S1 RNA binding domain protein [Mycoplasmopsis canis]EIE41063.1 30S ribosomal protein S1 [Mycoplasmopsis canis UF31]EIE42326.1 30S ribosomal protein S1 [Mycoplasmopsis canis UFG1]EIE42401.1 30S ribosomal protein S1 [Mycoplasmopsis canis UFG4]WQQ12400.1 RNA-binding protein [Mycoplasmopsis canis]